MICKARVEPTLPPVGECTKCGTMQRIDLCNEQLSIRSGSENLALHAFGKLVEDLCSAPSGGDVTTDALLSAPAMSRLTFNSSKIITSVARD